MVVFKKILCPTDFSGASRLTVGVAADLVARDKGELHLLHVVEVEPPLPSDPNFLMEFPEYERTLHAKVQRKLDALAACFKTVRVRTSIGHGDPGKEIVCIAQEEAADLIVMPTHGRTGVEHVVFGSVAEEVVRHAHRPVLTMPAAPNALRRRRRQARSDQRRNHHGGRER